MTPTSTPSERITRLRERYQDEMTRISIERARLYTEKWFATEDAGLSLNERVALSMKHVYEHMTMLVDPDDRIAGHWTEFFIGTPIDIEKGIFNLRIVHGKGKGVQREIVHSILKDHPQVASFRHEGGSGGGWGATVLTLKACSD